MIGRGCIPYWLMKNGYRRIPIFDNDSYICDVVFVLGLFKKIVIKYYNKNIFNNL